MSRPKILTAYDPAPDAGIDFSQEKSLTQQQFVEECDINNIVNKYLSTGEITHLAQNSPLYADVSEIPDFQSALNFVIAAQAGFDALPSHVRERFANDPQKLIDFLDDDKNYDEAAKLGLVEPKTAPEEPQKPSGTSVPETKTANPEGSQTA